MRRAEGHVEAVVLPGLSDFAYDAMDYSKGLIDGLKAAGGVMTNTIQLGGCKGAAVRMHGKIGVRLSTPRPRP